MALKIPEFCGRKFTYYGIAAKAAKKFKATTNSKHNLPVAGNLLNQNFEPNRANKVWASDITYIPTLEGWMCLAVILDIYSKQVIGPACGEGRQVDHE